LDREEFVDRAIAIVVFFIADLWGGQDFAFAVTPHTQRTDLLSGAAGGDPFGSGRPAVRTFSLDVFIDLAVAVVVEAITKLGGRLFSAVALPPATLEADAFARLTDAGLSGIAGFFGSFRTHLRRRAFRDGFFRWGLFRQDLFVGSFLFLPRFRGDIDVALASKKRKCKKHPKKKKERSNRETSKQNPPPPRSRSDGIARKSDTHERKSL